MFRDFREQAPDPFSVFSALLASVRAPLLVDAIKGSGAPRVGTVRKTKGGGRITNTTIISQGTNVEIGLFL